MLDQIIRLIIILLLLSNMALFGVTLLNGFIRISALQGILLGTLVVLAQWGNLSPRFLIIAGLSIVIKTFVFPFLMHRAVRESGVRREAQSFLGPISSIFAALAFVAFSIWFSRMLPLKIDKTVPFLVPAALMTMFTGIFLIVGRRTALAQCLGFIVCENGIYLFGMVTVGEVPALIELGLLLDALVAVFVMGIAISYIHREFDDIDTDALSSLKG